MPKKEFFQYDDLHKMTDDLILQIKKSKFNPDVVVSIAMGGTFLGYLLTKGLGVSKFESIQVQSYDGEKQGQIIDLIDGKFDFQGKNILLVDDLVDSGKTIDYVLQNYFQQAKSVKTAVRIYKEGSIVKPDFYSKDFGNERIVFPYEVYE